MTGKIGNNSIKLCDLNNSGCDCISILKAMGFYAKVGNKSIFYNPVAELNAVNLHHLSIILNKCVCSKCTRI